MFEPYLSRWELVPDGEAIVAHSSRLLPVLYRGEKTMLKIAVEAEEKRGGLLMLWWDGDDAARVLEHEDDAAARTRHRHALARSDGARRTRRRGEPYHLRGRRRLLSNSRRAIGWGVSAATG